MKKKFMPLLMIFSMTFSLIGANYGNNNNYQENEDNFLHEIVSDEAVVDIEKTVVETILENNKEETLYDEVVDTFDKVIDQSNETAMESLTPSGISTNDFQFPEINALERKIAGYVWLDLNEDGIMNNGEPGVSGVTVDLHDSNKNGRFLSTTTTNDTGYYEFKNLSKGSYYIKVKLLASDNYIATQHENGNEADKTHLLESIATDTAYEKPYIIFGGKVNLNNNNQKDLEKARNSHVGLIKETSEETFSISGFSWHEKAETNIYLDDVVFELLDNTGDVITDTLSLADGSYEFADLDKGSYVIRVYIPEGLSLIESGLFTKVEGKDYGETNAISLLEDLEDINAVFVDTPPLKETFSISGFAWHEEAETETYLENVVFELLDSNGDFLDNTLSLLNGSYGFADLDKGSYIIRVHIPVGLSLKENGLFTKIVGEDYGETDIINLLENQENINAVFVDATETPDVYIIRGNIFLVSGTPETTSNLQGISVELIKTEPALNKAPEEIKGANSLLTHTDENGNYLYTLSAPDEYVLRVHYPDKINKYSLINNVKYKFNSIKNEFYAETKITFQDERELVIDLGFKYNPTGDNPTPTDETETPTDETETPTDETETPAEYRPSGRSGTLLTSTGITRPETVLPPPEIIEMPYDIVPEGVIHPEQPEEIVEDTIIQQPEEEVPLGSVEITENKVNPKTFDPAKPSFAYLVFAGTLIGLLFFKKRKMVR